MLHSVSGKTMNGKEYSLNCKKKKKKKNLYPKKIPSLSIQNNILNVYVNRKRYGFTLLQVIAKTLRLVYSADQILHWFCFQMSNAILIIESNKIVF